MKIGMVFPDYGSQFVGMGKELYDTSRIVQEYFEEAYNCLNINFVKLCFASSEAELSLPEHAYVALFLTSVSIAAVIRQQGIPVDEVAGFGIGQFSALCAAGGISLPDGLYFLQKYAGFYKEFLANQPVKAYTIAHLSTRKLKKIVDAYKDRVHIALFINDTTHVITGFAQDVEQCVDACKTEKALCRQTAVEQGLHSPLMHDIVMALKPYFEKIDIKNIHTSLVVSSSDVPLTEATKIKRSIIKQIETPVMWPKIAKHMHDWDIVIAVGPGTMLQPMLQELLPATFVRTVQTPADIELLLQDYQTRLQPASL